MSKIKKIKKQIGGDGNLVDMFNQLVGGEPKLEVAKPKIEKLLALVKTIEGLLDHATKSLSKYGGRFTKQVDEITRFVKELNKISTLSIEDKDIPTRYVKLKDDNTVRTILKTCRNLITYKIYLVDCQHADDSFITKHIGLELYLLPFTSLNFKEIWMKKETNTNAEEANTSAKKYLLFMITILQQKSFEVYQLVTSPDVNIKEFSSVLVKSISQLKKQIPRCDKAFKRIEDSVSLLEGNFSDYYKDMIQTKNPSTIMENFVLDVAKNQNADPELTRQFRKIIGFYKKAQSNKKKDPKLNKIFEMLDNNFSILDRKTNTNTTLPEDVVEETPTEEEPATTNEAPNETPSEEDTPVVESDLVVEDIETGNQE